MEKSQKQCCGSLWPSSWPTVAIDHNSVRHGNAQVCPYKNFQEEMKKKRVGCGNKLGNKAAQAAGKDCQNVLNAGELKYHES